MRQWLVVIAEPTIVVIDVLALLTIAVATVQAFFCAARLAFSPSSSEQERRDVWMRYGRWLVAGLTFQLAADIIETSITTSWDVVGRIAAIAVIRTFLNYFLEREFSRLR